MGTNRQIYAVVYTDENSLIHEVSGRQIHQMQQVAASTKERARAAVNVTKPNATIHEVYLWE